MDKGDYRFRPYDGQAEWTIRERELAMEKAANEHDEEHRKAYKKLMRENDYIDSASKQPTQRPPRQDLFIIEPPKYPFAGMFLAVGISMLAWLLIGLAVYGIMQAIWS